MRSEWTLTFGRKRSIISQYIFKGLSIQFNSKYTPPIHQDRPRFSTSTSHKAAELAAVALVNESPTAATMSISPESTTTIQMINSSKIQCLLITCQPGRSWWTLSGTVLLRNPRVLHGNGRLFGTRFCRNFPLWRWPVPPSKLFPQTNE